MRTPARILGRNAVYGNDSRKSRQLVLVTALAVSVYRIAFAQGEIIYEKIVDKHVAATSALAENAQEPFTVRPAKQTFRGKIERVETRSAGNADIGFFALVAAVSGKTNLAATQNVRNNLPVVFGRLGVCAPHGRNRGVALARRNFHYTIEYAFLSAVGRPRNADSARYLAYIVYRFGV